MRKPAVTLLSGGLDSATALAIARSQGFENHALTFEYGQRHLVEIEAARRVARSLAAATHQTVKIDSRILAGSALTSAVAVPKSRTLHEIAEGIPITYVAARNAIFLAHALGYAETLGASDIFIGVNALDYSGYPDCRPEFIRAFETMANLGTKAGIEGQKYSIHTPLIELTKAEIIRKGAELGVDFSVTHSCYDPSPDGRACGECDSCQLRRKGFQEAGVVDPTQYAA